MWVRLRSHSIPPGCSTELPSPAQLRSRSSEATANGMRSITPRPSLTGRVAADGTDDVQLRHGEAFLRVFSEMTTEIKAASPDE
jgi:hypothetical protein